MRYYGVRRLVAINSGNYVYAEIDLSRPVHLAAPNNRGKSTLVNALQFLYIDDFSKMKFGRRTHEDTRRHYFGGEPSYLVFECRTPSGIQSMLVRGLSSLRDGHFERYVYDGEFQKVDYVDGDEIRSFDAVRTRLADRHLARVKNSDLWRVLAGNLPPNDGKPIPRLNILPIHRHDEYTAFRDVFVRLLSLTNADARTLRQLIIDAHARDVGERKIDVAAQYKDEFDRAERSEHHLQFIRTVAEEIDRGRELRHEIGALSDKCAAAAPVVWHDLRRCHALIEAEANRLAAELERSGAEQEEIRNRQKSLFTNAGLKQAERTALEREWEALNATHHKWSAYVPGFIKGMRENAERRSAEIAEIEQHLQDAQKLDLQAMRRQVARLEQQIATDRAAYEHWEQTAAAALGRAGVPEAELDAAFRIGNPDLLKLIVGKTVTIKDLEPTVDRIRTVARRVEDGTYEDDAVKVDVSGIAGPDPQTMRDPKQLLHQIVLNEQERDRQSARLKTAEDQETARERLAALRKEDGELRGELAEYDRYAKAWGERADLQGRLERAKQGVAEVQREIADTEKRLKRLAQDATRLQRDLTSVTNQKERLSAAGREFRQEAERLGLESSLPAPSDDQGETEAARHRSLTRFIERVIGKLSAATADLRRIDASRSQLREVQNVIAEKSRHFETQQRYFSDEDEEWNLLIEAHDSLPQLEATTEKSWDGLFTILGARFRAIVTAVSSIKTAVERINRGLKAFQVSNLRAVQIAVEEERATYPAVEALSGQGGLFQDRDAWDINKRRLRQMIERNEPIELESLFELRIHIQETDGTWRQAASLDDIGSTGTGMTAKAMIFIRNTSAI